MYNEGVEIHARSVFLQGLLENIESIPQNFLKYKAF